MTANKGKDVIYIDVDDEITGIIDKVTSAPNKIVALVLPKRAAMFQSVVNMKLLKKRADAANKNLVLITSEQGLMPLAGIVGLHVAQTLQSKPEVPEAAPTEAVEENIDEAVPVDGEDFDTKKSADKPVGELARGTSSINAASQMPEETIELDNTDTQPPVPTESPDGKDVAALAANGAAGKVGKKAGKNKKLKVPNFERFRLVLVLGGLGIIVLIVLFVFANNALAKARVTIQTTTSNVNSSLTPLLDANVTSLDATKQIVPAKVDQVQQTYTGQAAASGKQNNGTKASGNVTMTAQECGGAVLNGAPPDVPAGSGVNANGLTFITQESTAFASSGTISNGCATYQATSPTTIAAQQGGTQYNLASGTTFSLPGRGDVSAAGSTSGGTDDVITVVQQSDIDSARQQAESGINKSSIQSQLQQQLQGDGMFVISNSFSSGNPSVTASAKAGDQATNVTVTEAVTYTMFGVKQSDLQQLVAASVDQQIDPNKQAIQDYGLSGAQISVPNAGNSTKVQISLQVTSVIGPHLDQAQIKNAIAGKKSGEAQTIIQSYPGVQSVQVHLSPFWSGSVPKNPNKITLTYQKSSGSHG